jgi:hypothetical protein
VRFNEENRRSIILFLPENSDYVNVKLFETGEELTKPKSEAFFMRQGYVTPPRCELLKITEYAIDIFDRKQHVSITNIFSNFS